MITIKLERKGVRLESFVENQIPFAMSRTLNALTRSIQSGVQNGTLEREFTIAPERRQFMRRLVKIRPEDNAKKGNLVARVRIEEPEGTSKGKNRAKILTRHEEGGSQVMNDYPFFMPTKHLRPGSRSLVSRKWYPAALRLKDMRGIGGATGKVVKGRLKGKRRQIAGVSADLRTLKAVGLGGTFILTPKSNPKAWGIYQRVGSGKGGDALQMLWAFRPKINIRPRLHWKRTSESIVRGEYGQTFKSELQKALATAKR